MVLRQMQRLAYLLGAFYGFTGVALGAFGAHGLKDLLEANEQTANFQTASRYQMVHALLLLGLGLLAEKGYNQRITAAIWSATSGILVFSGTLYLLALTNLKWLGAITPIGGLLLLVAWALLFVYAWQMKTTK